MFWVLRFRTGTSFGVPYSLITSVLFSSFKPKQTTGGTEGPEQSSTRMHVYAIIICLLGHTGMAATNNHFGTESNLKEDGSERNLSSHTVFYLNVLWLSPHM